jgi:hypothetical protein
MTMQNQTSDTQDTGLVIAATSHCRNGKQPRWSFLVQGFGGQGRHGMLGTDEHGRGLYLYASQPGSTPARRELVAPERLSLPDSLSRHQANDAVMTLMGTLSRSDSQLAT